MSNSLFRFLTAGFVLYSLTLGAIGQTKAFDISRMDTSADACDDFFQYANGTWVKNTPIPPSEARWGSFNSLAENNRNVSHEILEKVQRLSRPFGTNMTIESGVGVIRVTPAASPTRPAVP